MGILFWITQNWFELLQSLGIISGFLFTAYSVSKEEKARQIANLISIKQQHREIWREPLDRPELLRVLKPNVDLINNAVTEEETLFVTSLFLHLRSVYRAQRAGMFVELQGLKKDINEFLALPIPSAVWKNLKLFQDQDFVAFVQGQ